MRGRCVFVFLLCCLHCIVCLSWPNKEWRWWLRLMSAPPFYVWWQMEVWSVDLWLWLSVAWGCWLLRWNVRMNIVVAEHATKSGCPFNWRHQTRWHLSDNYWFISYLLFSSLLWFIANCCLSESFRESHPHLSVCFSFSPLVRISDHHSRLSLFSPSIFTVDLNTFPQVIFAIDSSIDNLSDWLHGLPESL